MAKVSVIVPVYKVENYLKKCVNSLINQTLKDIEIILVNASNDYLKFIEETYLNNTTYQKSLINGCRTNIINYEFNNIPFSLGKLYAIRYYVEYRTPAKQKKN